MSEAIHFEVDDGIATLSLDVAGKPMNVVTPAFKRELAECIERVANDAGIRGVIVASRRDSFMAGADLKSLATVFEQPLTVEEMLMEHSDFSKMLRRLETCGKPVVAAINGTALGAGLELCLACHRRIAADNPRALLGLPEVTVGLLPGAGGIQRLIRLIGIEKAVPLLTQGTKFDPRYALDQGIVHAVVEPARLMTEARNWLLSRPSCEQPWDRKDFRIPGGGIGAARMGELFASATALTARATQRNYPAPIAILSAVYEGSVVPIDAALRIESRYFVSLLRNPVARNMTRTMFINKGAADKLVRRPEGVPASRVERLGIVGAGMMGAGIAYVSARGGMNVILLDATIDKAEGGKEYSRKLMAGAVEKGKATQEEMRAVLDRIKTTADYSDLAACTLVIEAVFEERAIKADVTRKTDAVVPAGAVLASNTSTLPITGLAEAARKPENFIGLHFFSPVDRMPLVEVILGKRTSPEALAKALDYVQQIRKTPIVVNDRRGFYTSRVFATYTNEGMSLLKDGVHPALIENAAKQAGMAVGPLAVSDEVTLELIYKVDRQARADLGKDYTPGSATDVVVKMYELKRWGKRSDGGFYEYPPGQRKMLWPKLAELFPRAATQPIVEECKRRLLYIQALESARCYFERVLTSPADADIGSILGWGFPVWTGGTLSLIETVGVEKFVAECDRLASAHGERFRPPESLRDMARGDGRFHERSELSKHGSAAR